MQVVNITINEERTVVQVAVNQATAGLSAYMDAVVNNGYTGTKQQWFLEMKGILFEDLTPQQIEMLRGAALTWEDLTYEQKAELKGDPWRWQDFTPEMLEELKGDRGEQGPPSMTGSGAKVTGVDAGEYGEESYADGYIYKCVQEGEAGIAVWVKWAVQPTT